MVAGSGSATSVADGGTGASGSVGASIGATSITGASFGADVTAASLGDDVTAASLGADVVVGAGASGMVGGSAAGVPDGVVIGLSRMAASRGFDSSGPTLAGRPPPALKGASAMRSASTSGWFAGKIVASHR